MSTGKIFDIACMPPARWLVFRRNSTAAILATSAMVATVAIVVRPLRHIYMNYVAAKSIVVERHRFCERSLNMFINSSIRAFSFERVSFDAGRHALHSGPQRVPHHE